jgi:hypothetical protein
MLESACLRMIPHAAGYTPAAAAAFHRRQARATIDIGIEVAGVVTPTYPLTFCIGDTSH